MSIGDGPDCVAIGEAAGANVRVVGMGDVGGVLVGMWADGVSSAVPGTTVCATGVGVMVVKTMMIGVGNAVTVGPACPVDTGASGITTTFGARVALGGGAFGAIGTGTCVGGSGTGVCVGGRGGGSGTGVCVGAVGGWVGGIGGGGVGGNGASVAGGGAGGAGSAGGSGATGVAGSDVGRGSGSGVGSGVRASASVVAGA